MLARGDLWVVEQFDTIVDKGILPTLADSPYQLGIPSDQRGFPHRSNDTSSDRSEISLLRCGDQSRPLATDGDIAVDEAEGGSHQIDQAE